MNPLTKRLLALGASSVVAVTGGMLVAPWEGKENHAYRDLVGVNTICFGQTKGVRIGDYKTDEECEKDLASELTNYNTAMKKYVTVPLRDYEEVAYTSFIWNLGETNWRGSTILKKLNAGDRAGACAQLLRWNMARGKEVKGLTNRRNDEYKTCMGGRADIKAALAELTLNAQGPVDIEVGEILTHGPGIPEIQEEPTEPVVQIVEKACRFKFLGICFGNK